MKLAILITACMAIVAVQSTSIPEDHTVVNKAMLEKQRFIYEILYRMDDKLTMDEWLKQGEKLITDKSMYTGYPELMTKFEHFYMYGGLLPRGEFFSTVSREHVFQGFGLFNFFYYAKDFETFVKNVAWARNHVSEGMFVYALTMATNFREDMQGIILPQIYEIFPQMFFSSKYILAAEKFDWEVFNQQILLEKEFKTVYDQKYPSGVFENHFYLKDWKVWQWWKLMGLDDGWHLEDMSLHKELSEYFKALDPKFTSNLKMAWLPVDYTRDIGIFNADSKLSYFTEDVGWNAYWYNLNMKYYEHHSGEWWNFNVRQLLARLYMERLSQGFGAFEKLSWYGTIDTGYDSQLVAYNGNGFTFRKNYWEIDSTHNSGILGKMMSIERKIEDLITTGKCLVKDSKAVDLKTSEFIKYVGELLEGSVDIDKMDFFIYWWTQANKFLSGEEYSEFTVDPNVMANFETMFRDPLSYGVLKIIADGFLECLNKEKPYTNAELHFSGVKIEDIEVSKLETYFDLVDIDVTTLLNDKMVFHDGKLVCDKTLLFRQQRLNHKEFTYTTKVESDKPQKVVVRGFIGPAFDEYGQKLSMVYHRENYMEFDKFVYELVAGDNVIKRSSKDFTWTSSDPHTYSELYNYLDLAYEGKFKFHQNISQSHSLFPDRLVLPHGWIRGMPMVMFFMITPFPAEHEQYHTYGPSGSGIRSIDNLPFGYPFDRKIIDLYEFVVPNMYFKNVKIYHVDKLDKYYPLKYEHYGTFDEDF